MTPAERLRKHQRSLEKTQRELDRERTKLENQEKKLIQEIKKSAKNGQMGACKIQAKDLVRTRRYIEKFYSMRTQLQAISLRIQVRYLPLTAIGYGYGFGVGVAFGADLRIYRRLGRTSR
jgi:division protein CdvB (Snf7/Vps24/ESCRT-III family)